MIDAMHYSKIGFLFEIVRVDGGRRGLGLIINVTRILWAVFLLVWREVSIEVSFI